MTGFSVFNSRDLMAIMSRITCLIGILGMLFTETEDIRLSPEEQCYYEERFENAVIPLDQLEIAEVIGEGAST